MKQLQLTELIQEASNHMTRSEFDINYVSETDSRASF